MQRQSSGHMQGESISLLQVLPATSELEATTESIKHSMTNASMQFALERR